jgi:DNA invertase Pin-like site-specific DNA recombinase
MPKSREPSSRSSKRLRCAVYTRKSSDEGLEQAFNSLDAQREACAAFVLSQKHEGWSVLPTLYDDGGYSGGTLDRPALQRLLADIAEGKVDVVVVYKIDRLTRSLFDFAKIVEVFEAKEVSFVSITQQFNTTTSMGRLTLNILLSFAQFERELAGERIRDKIAASKKKGMWMGGLPHLKLKVKARLQRVSREMKLVVHNAQDRKIADPGLLRIVARAHDFQERLMQTPDLTVPAIASQERLTIGYLSRLLRLPSLAPDIVMAIINGKHPPQLSAKRLMRLALNLPTDWAEQRKLLGFQRP